MYVHARTCTYVCVSILSPPHRLEDLAVDAELQEKSLMDLEKLATALHHGCSQAEEECLRWAEPDFDDPPKKKDRPKGKDKEDKDKGAANFKLCGVLINGTSILKRRRELEVLAKIVPKSLHARKR